MEEHWKDISGYEGLYSVSNTGLVKTHIYNKILKPIIQLGYETVVLYRDKKCKAFKVHRLVAMVFIPNPNNLPQVNHKDGNKRNNFVFVNEDGTVDLNKSNLEWCTAKQNTHHAINKGLFFSSSHISKYQPIIIKKDKNGNVVGIYKTVTEAATKNHVSRITIYRRLHSSNKNCDYTYESDRSAKYEQPPKRIKPAVIQKTLDGIIVAKYSSILEAADANGVTRSAIYAAIRGYCKTCKNSIFEYE